MSKLMKSKFKHPLFQEIKMPGTIFLISIILFWFNIKFIKTTYPSLGSAIEAILEGLTSGSIFYFFTVSIPAYKQKTILKKITIAKYINIKKDMLRILLAFFGKKKNNIVEQSITDFTIIRQHITKEDLYTLANNLTISLAKDSAYFLSQLKEILIPLLTYDFVKNNKELHQRILQLNYWINQLKHNIDLYILDNEGDEFPELFAMCISSFLLGNDYIEKPRDKDDLIELIDHS